MVSQTLPTRYTDKEKLYALLKKLFLGQPIGVQVTQIALCVNGLANNHHSDIFALYIDIRQYLCLKYPTCTDSSMLLSTSSPRPPGGGSCRLIIYRWRSILSNMMTKNRGQHTRASL